MEEKTADEIAAIFSAAGDSVTVINTAKTSDETDDEQKDKIKRNVEHLEIIKAYKKEDETTSIWTSEDFTAIDKAVVDGKKVYSQVSLVQLFKNLCQLYLKDANNAKQKPRLLLKSTMQVLKKHKS